MPRFDKIDELISELNRNRQLFSALFDKRMHHIQEEIVLHLVDDDVEKLERLTSYGLLFRNQSLISLDTRLQDFFEEYLEVDEAVHVFYIQDHLDQIKRDQSYFLKEKVISKRDQYIIKIKKNLRSIIRITVLNVKTLRNNTDETYKTESNFEIKREKLDNIRSQRDALEGVINAVKRLLEDDLFFKTAADDELLMILHQLRLALDDCFNNLIEIQQQIIEYINHIEKRVEVVDKVLKLKMLYDKHYLKERTNFYLLANASIDLPLQKQENFRTRLSIADMQNDETMQKLVFKVRDKLKNKQFLAQNISGKIPDEAFENNQKKEEVIVLNKLKTIFLGKDQDLFSFVMSHQFNKLVSSEERIKLYCRLASLYEKEFEFTNECAHYNDLEYALIFPKAEKLTNNIK